jgi:hypothetical protein
MFFMGDWLPYRVRNWLNQQRLQRALRGLVRTAPVKAASPSDATAEVYLLACKRDLTIGIVALKSLLRFANDNLAVTVTTDGSLSDRDRKLVEHHIPNHRWLSWPDESAEKSEFFAGRPNLLDMYRSPFPFAPKLLHPFIHARTNLALALDADTAFFKSPTSLENWWTGKDAAPCFMHDHQNENEVVPEIVHTLFGDLQKHMNKHHKALPDWGVDRRFFNAGLLAYDTRQLNLDHAESYLAWRKTVSIESSSTMDIWFGNWTSEQTCYHVMFAYSDPPPRPLGNDYWLGGGDGHVFNHFLRHYLMRPESHTLLSEMISTLD